MTIERRQVNIRWCGVSEADFDRYRARFVGVVWPALLAHEGGYANRSTDAGGPTSRGGVTWGTVMDLWARHREWCEVWRIPYIPPGTQKSVAAERMKQMTSEQAQAIALVFYYIRTRLARLPTPWDRAALDWRYNGGPALTALQELAGVAKDGIIGPATCSAVEKLRRIDLELYFELRLEYLQSLKGPQGWESNGRGWGIRVARVKAECLKEWPVGKR